MDPKTLILMSDNRDLTSDLETAEYNSLVAFINFNYAKRFDYDFMYFRPGINGEFPAFNCFSKSNQKRYSPWSKILSCILASQRFIDYDKVVYIDSDCIFNNFDESVHSYLSNLQALQKYSSSTPVFTLLNDKPYSYDLPCTGFFIFNNTEAALKILTEWYVNDGGSESYYYNENHTWEQAIFQRLLPSLNQSIRIVDDYMFIDHSPIQLLRHIGSNEHHLRIPTFRKKIEDLGLASEFKETMEFLQNQIINYDTQKIVDSI